MCDHRCETKKKPGELCTSAFCLPLFWLPFVGYFQIWNYQLQADTERKQEALSRAAERAELDKERIVLTAQRGAMDELGRLREALALAREEKATLDVELSKAQNRPQQQSNKPNNKLTIIVP